MRTPEEATELLCPLARTFGTKDAVPHCRGPVCAAWRWNPLSADILEPHIKRRVAELGGGLKVKEATAWVMERREELGIPTKPTHGCCGLAV